MPWPNPNLLKFDPLCHLLTSIDLRGNSDLLCQIWPLHHLLYQFWPLLTSCTSPDLYWPPVPVLTSTDLLYQSWPLPWPHVPVLTSTMTSCTSSDLYSPPVPVLTSIMTSCASSDLYWPPGPVLTSTHLLCLTSTDLLCRPWSPPVALSDTSSLARSAAEPQHWAVSGQRAELTRPPPLAALTGPPQLVGLNINYIELYRMH